MREALKEKYGETEEVDEDTNVVTTKTTAGGTLFFHFKFCLLLLLSFVGCTYGVLILFFWFSDACARIP